MDLSVVVLHWLNSLWDVVKQYYDDDIVWFISANIGYRVLVPPYMSQEYVQPSIVLRTEELVTVNI